MRLARRDGEVTVRLEGEPLEIIQVLEYLDSKRNKESVVPLPLMGGNTFTLTVDGEEIGKAIKDKLQKAMNAVEAKKCVKAQM